jgi:3-phenylpropionate/trans-cinnamate dioxygenase ferredoxin reductase subunit
MDGRRIVIVGAGQAGGTAAAALREGGFAGRILLLGEEPHPPYERPPLSKEVLTRPEPATPWLRPPGAWEGLGVEVLTGARAVRLDPAAGRLGLGDGRDVAWDALLVATGGRARRLPDALGPGAARVHYLRTMEDALRLRAALGPGVRVAVVGAGVVGLECAASARALGSEVVVVEAAPRPLGRCVAPEIADWLVDLHRERGVAIRLGARLLGLEAEGAGVRLRLDGEDLSADVVVAGVGMERDVALAEGAGIAVEDGAVACDEFGRTSAPGVLAAGDAAAWHHPLYGRRLRLESWQSAQGQALAAARTLLGAPEPHAEVPWFWTDQHGANVQIAGLPQEAARTVWRGAPEGGRFAAFHLDEGGRVVAATTVNQGRDMRFARALVRARAAVDPGLLADETVPLKSIVG